ncbi:hypothetical protein ACFQH8_18665, partial [Halomicroarcula sp. GCM10025710]
MAEDDRSTMPFSPSGVDSAMSPTANGRSFGKRFGVALLLGIPGIVALVGYIYFTTPVTAVPPGLSPTRSPLGNQSTVTPRRG